MRAKVVLSVAAALYALMVGIAAQTSDPVEPNDECGKPVAEREGGWFCPEGAP